MKDQIGIWDDQRITFDECVDMTIDSIKQIEGMYDTWLLMWSGGKDSTTMVTLLLQLIRTGQIQGPQNLRIYISDTRMELVPLWINALSLIEQIKDRGHHVSIALSEIDDRFWVYMLGYGVPPPSNTFRWCTQKLKIDPANKMMRDDLAIINGTPDDVQWGKALMMTGVRLGESAARDARISMSCGKDGTECGQGHYHHMSETYLDRLAPIIHWRTCVEWDWLKLFAPMEKYGGWNTALLADAYGDGEDPSTRTGCIGCNLASKDKALLTIIKNPKWSYLSPLLEIRALFDWLKLPGQRLRKTGYQVTKSGQGSKNQNRMGPLTLPARKEGLKRLKDILRRVNKSAEQHGRPTIDLLNEEEEQRIKWHWEKESFPQGWTGNEQLASEDFIQFFKDGSSQPSVFDHANAPKNG